jgi:hypothetical protein
MQITEALKLQMEVQKRLHEQLEVYFLVELIRQLYYISRLYFFLMLSTYEARTLLGLGVSRCWTHVGVRHQHNINTYAYIALWHFLKLLSLLACQCPCHVWCQCPCFTAFYCIWSCEMKWWYYFLSICSFEQISFIIWSSFKYSLFWIKKRKNIKNEGILVKM